MLTVCVLIQFAHHIVGIKQIQKGNRSEYTVRLKFHFLRLIHAMTKVRQNLLQRFVRKGKITSQIVFLSVIFYSKLASLLIPSSYCKPEHSTIAFVNS